MAKEKKEKHFINKPIYEGGIAAMKQFIAFHKIYPETAQKADIEGTVVLRYSINHKGIVTGAKVISGIGGGCDEEAIRLVKLLTFKVAKNRGVRATFHKDIKIHFRKPKVASVSPISKVQYAYTVSPTKKGEPNQLVETSNKTSRSYHFTINLNPSTDSNTSE